MNIRRTQPEPRAYSRWVMPVIGAALTLLIVALVGPRMPHFPWERFEKGDDDSAAFDQAAALADAAANPAPAIESATPPPANNQQAAIDAAATAEETGGHVHIIEAGEALGKILTDLGATVADIDSILAASLAADYDLSKRLKAGRELRINNDPDGTIRSISTMIDPETLLTVSRGADGNWSAAQTPPAWLSKAAAFGMRIDSTMWDASIRAGLDPTDANTLAALFDREVELASAIRAGDRVSVVFEALYLDGAFVRHGAILAARFRRGSELIELVPWSWKERGIRSFTPEGKATDRRYLRSPLDIGRMSSEVGTREHPVLGGQRVHQGIDYPAPHGTPVRAIGEGTITKAGDAGGYGNIIIVNHGRSEESRYGHLARFAAGIREGATVQKGQIIAYVGSTGLSSGSHLHFEFRVQDQVVDFNKRRPEVSGQLQLEGENLRRFQEEATRRLNLLDEAEARALVQERRAAPQPTAPH